MMNKGRERAAGIPCSLSLFFALPILGNKGIIAMVLACPSNQFGLLAGILDLA